MSYYNSSPSPDSGASVAVMRNISSKSSTRFASSLCFFVGALILMAQTTAWAQSARPIIELDPSVVPSISVPATGTDGLAVRIHTHTLDRLEPGDSIAIEISPQERVQLRILQRSRIVNGDSVIDAGGQSPYGYFSLTMTLGANSLFGHISAQGELWQIAAVADWHGTGVQLGWIYRPGMLDTAGEALTNDFFIPSSPTGLVQPAKRVPVLPLKLHTSDPERQSIPASTAKINADNFSITQEFSPDPVVIGQTVAASISLRNISSEVHTNLVLDVFFLLEDSELISSDSLCAEQLSESLQAVLRCALGDFGPGEEKTVHLRVQTSEHSRPSLLSTVVVGELRNDKFVNVVEDVRSDSDADGMSDFNEALLGTDPLNADSVDFSASVIDVMALYTPGAATLFPDRVETRINQLVAVANQIYRDSGVAINLRAVHHQEIAYNDVDDMDTALNHMIEQSHPAFSGLHALRASYGADLVMLFRPLELSGDRCGLAPVGGFRTNGYFDANRESPFAFSHIAIDCPLDLAVAHELGHNMGLTHSHLEDGYGGTFDFSTGFGVDGAFATVMAYPGVFNTDRRIAQFSNPQAECLGFACGKSADGEFGADAVQSLNLVRHQVANYSPTVVPDLPQSSVTALSGNTDATIAIAASSDAGRSFTSRFSPADRVDMTATIGVDNRHIGSSGSLHVLVGELGSESLYQLNSGGELTQWNGAIDSLIPVGAERILQSEERLSLLYGFQFGEEFVGLDLVLYIGYRASATADFIYTDEPLQLSIIKTE